MFNGFGNGYGNNNEDYMQMFNDMMKKVNEKNKKVVYCQKCNKKIKVTVNKKNKCPYCQHIFKVETK